MLLVLSFLNFIDGLCTYVGLSTNAIQEANPIMGSIWGVQPALFLGIKLFFSLMLLYFYARRGDIQLLSKKYFNIAINVVVIPYALVALLHFVWIIYYLKFL